MAEYMLFYNATETLGVKVEADNLEEAIDKGYDALPGSVCAQCSGWGKTWSRESGEHELDEEAAKADYPDES